MHPTYPVYPIGKGAPANAPAAAPASTPAAPPLSIDETIRAIAAADDLLSGLRADLDSAARGRRYQDMQTLAAKIQEAAQVGQQRTTELERLQDARRRDG